LNEIIIASAARTPIGSWNGSLRSVPAHCLREKVIAEALRRRSWVNWRWRTASWSVNSVGAAHLRRAGATVRTIACSLDGCGIRARLLGFRRGTQGCSARLPPSRRARPKIADPMIEPRERGRRKADHEHDRNQDKRAKSENVSVDSIEAEADPDSAPQVCKRNRDFMRCQSERSFADQHRPIDAMGSSSSSAR
jgi:hypothetical protein